LRSKWGLVSIVQRLTMKTITPRFALLILPVLMLVLSGCPIGLDYSPAETGSEKFNKKLVGTWRFQPTDESKDAEVLEVKFERENDKTIRASVKERGEMYSAETNEFLGYETDIDGLHVLFFKPDNEAKFYHYQYKMEDDNTLIIADISLLDGGVDAVTSTETLRDQIVRSMSKPEFYKEARTYKKVN
jgi:hypothetical protein